MSPTAIELVTHLCNLNFMCHLPISEYFVPFGHFLGQRAVLCTYIRDFRLIKFL